MPEPKPPRRRWFRFRLRTLLIAIAVIAIPLAWIGRERRQSWHEHQIGEQLHQLGFKDVVFGGPYDCFKSYNYHAPVERQAQWRQLAGRILGERIFWVAGPPPDFSDLTPFARLENLEYLFLVGAAVSDLSPLSKLKSLKYLIIEATRVSDLTPLGGLQNLQDLRIGSTQVTDIMPLSGLHNLRMLDARPSPLTIGQFEALQKALPNCTIQYILPP